MVMRFQVFFRVTFTLVKYIGTLRHFPFACLCRCLLLTSLHHALAHLALAHHALTHHALACHALACHALVMSFALVTAFALITPYALVKTGQKNEPHKLLFFFLSKKSTHLCPD